MMKQLEFYCVSCRKTVSCKKADVGVIHYKNKKTGTTPALRCEGCPKCGTPLSKWVKKDDVDKLLKKFGKW